ncbi:LPS assembly lipoprotein LptE [Candidatus Thiodiazotropha endoloripes]|uniref:LPS-assembly lipoprotein LptE n=1 Tax=Candidatus Thiodiazotropha endoloripes TaxID=1818881 RepID=UPI001390B6B4|nr:LPS assembly lipoprotein LptE [Candidatus Thiodiazotropha endoloripes]
MPNSLHRWRLPAPWLALVLLLLLSGCGFHLKGYAQPSAALNGLYIVAGDRIDTVAGVLQRELLGGGVILSPDREAAKYLFQVVEEKFSSRVLSVDANGKALDNELRLRAKVRLTARTGMEPHEEQLELVRQLSFSGSDELGQRNETALMMDDMRRDLTAQIIRRMEAGLR